MIPLERIWYGDHPLGWLLAPLGWVYSALARWRRITYRRGWRAGQALSVPVVVIGNISVGGTGKTPLVVWLCAWLRQRGYRPGVLTRGYGGDAAHWPIAVGPDADPTQVGDEAVLLARRTHCPVMAGADRVASAERLIQEHACDILVADDGLQHYRLQRDIEIAVVDGVRRLGNRRCLPAGPLREPPERLSEVDMVIVNGTPLEGEYGMRLVPGPAVALRDAGTERELGAFRGEAVLAVAGIGNPQRFFDMLAAQGISVTPRPFPDHHAFRARDTWEWVGRKVLMTEKDAVKCAAFAGPDHWYVSVRAEPDARVIRRFEQLIDGLNNG